MTDLPPFWALVEAHGGELLAHAQRLVGHDAEDVLQEAFLRALRSYPRLDHGKHLRAWLYRIVTTTAFDHRTTGAKEIVVDPVPDRAHHPDGDDGFHELVDSLPPTARTALVMRYVDDLSYDVMARRLGCTPTAARQRVSTAVRTLRERHL
ncbi:MAG: RNA polymerase sigma factor [Actinomycetota bacterium]